MTKIYDIDATKHIHALAEEMKSIKEISPPAWATFVKTGVSKERPPVEKDWWYIRTAAILRKILRHGPIGVSKLRTLYGAIKNRGMAPDKFFKGSGSIIRKSLQQLEKAGLIKQTKEGVHYGRVITKKGKELLEKAAEKVLKNG